MMAGRTLTPRQKEIKKEKQRFIKRLCENHGISLSQVERRAGYCHTSPDRGLSERHFDDLITALELLTTLTPEEKGQVKQYKKLEISSKERMRRYRAVLEIKKILKDFEKDVQRGLLKKAAVGLYSRELQESLNG